MSEPTPAQVRANEALAKLKVNPAGSAATVVSPPPVGTTPSGGKPVINPFTYYTNLRTPYEMTKTAVGLFTLFPLRLMLVLWILCLAWIFARLSISFGFDETKPMTGLRRAIQYPIGFCARMMLFVLGFYWVEVKGRPCSAREARLVTVAPHSTFVDMLYITYAYNAPSAIGKIENVKIPLIGVFLRASQCVLVDRESREGKDKAMEEMKARASNPKERHFVIFPEGTCTNRRMLITFKRGAFVCGEPVQPVALEWPFHHFDPAWTSAGPNRLFMIVRLMCQFTNRLKVRFLPVYVPSEEEKGDPELFARNVRAKISEALGGVPTTSHSYEDMFLAKEARRLKVPVEGLNFEMREMHKLFNITGADAKALLRRYHAVLKDGEGGGINGPDFARVLNIPYTQPVRELFESLVETSHAAPEGGGGGRLNFPELLVGITMLTRTAKESMDEASLRLIWEAMKRARKDDVDDPEKMSERAVYDSLARVFEGFTRRQAKKLFEDATRPPPGSPASEAPPKVLTYEQFTSYLKTHPELLFVAFSTVAIRPSGGERLKVLKEADERKKGQTNGATASSSNAVAVTGATGSP